MDVRPSLSQPATLVKVTIAILALGTLLCLPLRPLWVDEIYQLQATRDQSFPAMFHSAMVAPGGMPLGYTVQKLWLEIAGFSAAQARVPAALFGLGSVWALAWVARLLNVNAGLVAILSLLTPLLFRYSTEARPYSQGLFFSVLATALFLRWWDRPSIGRLAAYSLCCLAGLYSQPFSIFASVAHCAYVLLADRKRVVSLSGAVLLPALLYAPWFLISSRALQHEAWPHLMSFSWHQVPPLVIIRELSGGGYVCSLSLLVLAGFGSRNPSRKFLLLWLTLPGILAIAADARFNYFFAIRQLIFVLPPLILLAASGFTVLWFRHRLVAVAFAGVYLIGAVAKDYRWQMDHKEDWETAARYLNARLNAVGGCVTFRPNRDAPSYYFFEPSLQAKNCQKTNQQANLIAVSPYAESEERRAAASGKNVGNTLVVMPSGSQ